MSKSKASSPSDQSKVINLADERAKRQPEEEPIKRLLRLLDDFCERHPAKA